MRRDSNPPTCVVELLEGDFDFYARNQAYESPLQDDLSLAEYIGNFGVYVSDVLSRDSEKFKPSEEYKWVVERIRRLQNTEVDVLRQLYSDYIACQLEDLTNDQFRMYERMAWQIGSA